MPETLAEADLNKASNIPITPSPGISTETPDGHAPIPVEFPILFRGFSEQDAEKANESWQKMKSASDQFNSIAQGALQGAFSTTVRECAGLGSGMMQAFQENLNANIRFAGAVMAARSPSELVEATTAQARRQMEFTVEHNRQLWTAAGKISTALYQPFIDWRGKLGKAGM